MSLGLGEILIALLIIPFTNTVFAAPFCPAGLTFTTDTIWTRFEVRSTITIVPQTALASTTSFESASYTSYHSPTQYSSFPNTIESSQGSTSLPIESGLCSENKPCTGDLTYFETAN